MNILLRLNDEYNYLSSAYGISKSNYYFKH